MCYICSCVAWALDLVQRMITFGLACVLCCAIAFGMSIAVIAGIAYGYNYSMAEFITFTRSDVTVFMRRGQFFDKPDISQRFRRTGDEEDLFSSNSTTDYEDQKPPAESKPLADTWLKTQDTRKYAEILTRYSPNKRADSVEPILKSEAVRESEVEQQSKTPRPHHFRVSADSPVISIVPNPLIPTVSWRSGSSEIMMRNFKPMQDYTSVNRNTEIPENLFPTPDSGSKSISIISPKEKAKDSADTKIRDDFHKGYVPMRVWGTTARPVIPDDIGEEVDEDNIVYKPV